TIETSFPAFEVVGDRAAAWAGTVWPAPIFMVFSECLEAGVEQGGSVAAGALQAHSRGLLQGAGRGVVTQAEEVANGGEDGVGMVVMKFGDGRADGGAGVVEELILEPHRHVGNGLAVGFAQVGVGGEEGGQLALAEL